MNGPKGFAFAGGLALALLLPASANAAASQVALVQAYAECTTPNAIHPTTPIAHACKPPVPHSGYDVRKYGRMTFSPVSRWVRISVSLPSVFDRATGFPAGFPSAGGPVQFSAQVQMRLTDEQCPDKVACTVVDTPVLIPLTCAYGKCVGSTRVKFAKRPLVFELQRVEVIDDHGALLASAGLEF